MLSRFSRHLIYIATSLKNKHMPKKMLINFCLEYFFNFTQLSNKMPVILEHAGDVWCLMCGRYIEFMYKNSCIAHPASQKMDMTSIALNFSLRKKIKKGQCSGNQFQCNTAYKNATA